MVRPRDWPPLQPLLVLIKRCSAVLTDQRDFKNLREKWGKWSGMIDPVNPACEMR